MVREGIEVQVVDAVTGEDLTRFVLTQIVVENAKTPSSAFPLDMLRQMIVVSGHASREGLLGYMKAMMDVYQNTYRAFTPAVSPFDFAQPKPDAAGATATQESAKEAQPSKQQPSMEELRRRVEELERLIPRRSAAKGPVKSGKSPGPKR